ncbi:MAG: hypothetical protein ACRC7O_04595, partial [Fimbriiglobus sp.]
AAPVAFAAPPPPSLAISAADRDRADGFVKLLRSPDFRDRDRGTRELRAMGRLALPTLKAAVDDPDAEVRGRVVSLVPAAEAADIAARAATFLADPDEKFEHGLPGWTVYQAAAGDTPAARELFAELFQSPANRDLMIGFARDKAEFARRLAARKADLLAQFQPRPAVPGQPVTPTKPGLPDVCVVLLADAALPDVPDLVRQGSVAQTFIYQPPFRTEITTGKYREPATAVLFHWLDSKSDAAGLLAATNIVSVLDQKAGVKYPLKVLKLAGPAVPLSSKAMAIATVGKLGGREHIPDLVRLFADDTILPGHPHGKEV